MGANIAALRRQIDLVKQATVSPEAFAKMHAKVAREEIGRLEAEQGKYPRRTFVDGREGAQEESVKPGGVIEYHISALQVPVDWIIAEWVKRSPVGPPEAGHYRDDVLMFVDGYRRDIGSGGAPVDVSGAAEIVVTNLRPYSRKLARGLSVQAPEGWIEVIANEAKRQFKDIAKIEFDYRSYGAPESRRGREGMNSRQRAQYRFPAIVVARY